MEKVKILKNLKDIVKGEKAIIVDLQLKLLEGMYVLENIQDKEDKVKVFKEIREIIEELHNKTTLRRKELKFVLNSLKGLIDGFRIFTNEEILDEVQLILSKLSGIKEHLINYTRNAIFKSPEGSCYLDLEPSHFIHLAKLQGKNKVFKNLVNLKWKDPNLVKWVDNIIEYIEIHKYEINKKGSFKDQLEGLQSIGNLAISRIEGEKGSLTFETAKFIHKLSNKPKQVKGERGWTTSPVFINCFDKVILRKLRELDYELKIFGQYVILKEAKCYFLKKNEISNEVIKAMYSLIPKPFIPIGRPVLHNNYCYWLCFEFPLASSIKMWNFL